MNDNLIDIAAWLVGLTATGLALLVFLATCARVVGYSARIGWDRGGRVKPPQRPPTMAGRGGGLCGVGHWVAPGARTCGIGHAYSHPKTRFARRVDISDAKTNWVRGDQRGDLLVDQAALAAELDMQRMAAGGW